jgi:hypothetical protein
VTILHRRWADLRLWRLALGLACAPLPGMVAILVAGIGVDGLSPERTLWYGRVAAETTLLWWILIGLIYLVAVTCWRRRIARSECLWLGTLSGPFFIVAIFLLRHFAPLAILRLLDLRPHMTSLAVELPNLAEPDAYVIAIICGFIGLLGGWIFWGIGIRPAPLPPPDAAIFE